MWLKLESWALWGREERIHGRGRKWGEGEPNRKILNYYGSKSRWQVAIRGSGGGKKGRRRVGGIRR